MSGMNPQSNFNDNMEVSAFQKTQPVDFNLTHDQYLYLQHFLPKRYALIQHKHIRKGQVVTSNVKLAQEDIQNISRLSGNKDNTDDIEGRTKRVRNKKVDKFLEEQPLKTKKIITQVEKQDDFGQCNFILAQLKKHKSAFPFLEAVDPKRDGVPHYFDIIKEPMDLSTIQSNLTNNVYTSTAEFHAHVNKIWANSYLFNQKGSLVHKYATDMQRYYKNLLSNDSYKKLPKMDKTKSRGQKQRKKQQGGQKQVKRQQNNDFIYEPTD